MMFMLALACLMAAMFGEKFCPSFFGGKMVKNAMFAGAAFFGFVFVMHHFFA